MSVLLVRDHNCNATVVLKDGTEIDVYVHQLVDKNLHHWQGWICNAGVDSIFIESDYTVYSAQCRNDKLGNLFDSSFSLFKDPTVCRSEHCSNCTSDLYLLKKKGN